MLTMILVVVVLYVLLVCFVNFLVVNGLHWLGWVWPISWIIKVMCLLALPGVFAIEKFQDSSVGFQLQRWKFKRQNIKRQRMFADLDIARLKAERANPKLEKMWPMIDKAIDNAKQRRKMIK